MDKKKTTELTSYYPVSEKIFREMAIDDLSPVITKYMGQFEDMLDEIEDYLSQHNSIPFTNYIYLDKKTGILFPDFSSYKLDEIRVISAFNDEEYVEEKELIPNYYCSLPPVTWLKRIKEVILEFHPNVSWVICKCDDERCTAYHDSTCAFSLKKDQLCLLDELEGTHETAVIFPVMWVDPSISSITSFLDDICCEYNICPRDVSEETKRKINSYILLSDYVRFEGRKMDYKARELTSALLENEDLLSKLHGNLAYLISQYMKNKKSKGVRMQSKEELLNCEKTRADIDPYEERMLTDPNRGHWDLWIDDGVEQYTVKTENEYMARNPRADIQDEGIIAIDFGTKSTIVVYQSDIEHSLPMGIGDGNLSKAPSFKRYENPTMMEFVNLDSFLEDYNSCVGRPNTKWEDLPISHTAMDKFENSKSEDYYAFLYQIKQWAGQRDRQFRVKPINGESRILPSFLDIQDGEFNPIEIYAYYIGLYINNMRKGHGIFLDYYLSFPVTYEAKIRQKIVESFEKGLKKSLPEPIQNDEEIMSRFKVNGDISEPAAYAVCALQEYGFDPVDDEEIFYGIFDFGGGTTDFDFGLWKNSTKKRYDYRIENFGAGGDEYLGGENLLEMLAFEIFKENQEVLRANNYTFTLAPKSKEFVGSDALLSDSQEAEKNMHNLMEQLRPFWEKASQENEEDDTEQNDHMDDTDKTAALRERIIDSTVDSQDAKNIRDNLRYYSESITEYSEDILVLKVDLFDKDGQLHPGVELETTQEFVDGFIEAKIRDGVKNFFAALLLSYQNDKVQKPTTVNILLAGNSCKSPVVRKVFDEEIEREEKRIKEQLKLDKIDKLFEIFPPLGTAEAYEKMEERGIPYSRDDFERPTGKTGVAFGLIQCRTGGSIERVSNVDIASEIDFQFFLGWKAKKKFVLFKDDTKTTKLKGKPDYNQWYQFIEADEETFYLYYTTLPECVSGNLMIEGNAAVKRLKCSIKNVNEDAFVYIRATSPHTIQYAVSTDYDVDRNHIGEIYEKELN